MKSYLLFVIVILFLCLYLTTELLAQEGKVLSLDGDGDYLEIPDFEGFKGGQNVVRTIESSFYWPGRDVGTQEAPIVAKALDASFKDWSILLRGDKIAYWAETNGADYRLTGSRVEANEWHHVGIVINQPNRSLRLFLNGELVVEDLDFGDHSARTEATVQVGITTYNTNTFGGLIDEVRIWNIARTKAQIQATMNTTLAGNEEGLVGYWNFDNGTASDLSTNSNHGELKDNARIVQPIYASPQGNDITGNGTITKPYQTCQRAIDAYNQGQGDLLYLLPGTYTENITLGREITLHGAGREKTVLTAESGEVIRIQNAQDVFISGLTIDGQTTASKGIVCFDSKVEISNAKIMGGDFCGVGHHNSQLRIHGCDIRNNTSHGIEGGGTSSITIFDNVITGSNIGIGCWSQVTGLIRDNYIRKNFAGIKCADNSSPTIDANLISKNNYEGIVVSGSAAPKIIRNTISHNVVRGITAVDSPQPLIGGDITQANTIINNGYEGIASWASSEIDATYNYWGVATEAEVEKEIVNLKDGSVKFKPFVGDPQLQTADRTYDLRLSKGLNMISLPLDSEIPYTARSLAEKIGNTTWVMTLDSANQKFIAHVPAIDTDNGFLIEGGKGYIINTTASRNVSFTGRAWSNPAAPDLAEVQAGTEGIWALLVMVNLPDQLRDQPSLRLKMTNLASGDVLGVPTALSDFSGMNNFRMALVDESRKSLVKLGDQVSLEILDSRDRPVGFERIRVTSDRLQSAMMMADVTYNPIPVFSKLLQNYPNPFNPETWIPYQISESGEVRLLIHDITGNLVRRLELGFRVAGMYTSRQRSIYWDGKTGSGEPAASGLYFYSVEVGEFSQTRRLVISK